MPTLTRLVLIIAGIAGIVYGSAYWLAESTEPNKTEIIIPVTADKFQRNNSN